MTTQVISQIAEIDALLQKADHVDVKTFRGRATMRGFIAAMFSYYPAWLKGLYGIRGVFVRLLGMKQEGIPMAVSLSAADVPMTADSYATFFKVKAAEDESFWLASANDSHLDAYLGVVVEGDDISAERSFHLVTIVHYKHWTGPVYFNVIRPFHHLVVRAMGNAGLKNQPQPAYV